MLLYLSTVSVVYEFTLYLKLIYLGVTNVRDQMTERVLCACVICSKQHESCSLRCLFNKKLKLASWQTPPKKVGTSSVRSCFGLYVAAASHVFYSDMSHGSAMLEC